MQRNGSPKLKTIKAGTLCCEASEIASIFNQQIKFDLGIGGGSGNKRNRFWIGSRVSTSHPFTVRDIAMH